MAALVTNNASATLASGITAGATTINVTAGQGAEFPNPGAGQYFYATLVDSSNNIEIVKVTARSTDALTVVRGQDGTTARAYNTGDTIELRPTAVLFNEKASLLGGTKLTSGRVPYASTDGDLTNLAGFTFDGTTLAVPGQLSVVTGTITVDRPALTGTQTWNDAGVTFTADKINVTDTASAAASLLWDRQVGGTSKGKLGKDGTLTIAGPLDLSGATSGQIKFPASQNASTNANTLDDYEEGSWTPSLGGTATYNNQAGNYVKIGRLVHVEFQLGVNTIGTGSANTVSGLPFTVSNDSTGGHCQVTYFTGLASTVTWVAFEANANTTSLAAYYRTSAGSAAETTTIFGNSARLFASGTYRSAS